MESGSQEFPLEIDVHAVSELWQQAAGSCLLLDCRDGDEHALVQIEGAQHLPMAETPDRIGELAPDPGQWIVVYCHHGIRSLQVVQWLRQQGYAKAQSMRGGIDAWSIVVDQRLPRY